MKKMIPDKGVRNILLLAAIVFVLPMVYGQAAQQNKGASPRVVTVGMPVYPPLARAAHIQGVVHLRITTNGHRVVATRVQDGHKLLAGAAEENLKTWEFAAHEPTTFSVTYRYRLIAGIKGDPSSPRVTLQLPKEVEVWAFPREINDPGAYVK